MWHDLSFLECIVYLYCVFIGVLLYVIVYKFNFFINLIIVSTINIITGLLLYSGIPTGKMFLLIIIMIVISFVWVYAASWFRPGFDYETIVKYIHIIAFVPFVLFVILCKLF